MARLGIARTFQIVQFGSLTVLENVMVGAMLRNKRVAVARQRAREALENSAASARAPKVTAANLTVAEQRRLELAQALATEPSCC